MERIPVEVIHQESTYAKHLAKRVEYNELVEVNEFKLEFAWLSNFYWHYGMLYTVEHEFQAAKASGVVGPDGTTTEHDKVLADKILWAETPGKAKRLGRTAKLPANWNRDRLSIMKRALERKFSHSPLKEWLLALGEIPLIEGNYWHDQYWGNCLCVRPKCQSAPGNNNLGKLLMEVRSELRERRHRGE